ncbi:ATP-binding protein [Candidatus Nitrososphaera gargensis]|uniref:ATP-binding protein n=1 Tax=Candidatus Nitrososphaera gargensis TaxID=497727 RepID=UPI00164F4AEA|nr:ATP-binding protein [Candidatus Nitrososphaera gargensis]
MAEAGFAASEHETIQVLSTPDRVKRHYLNLVRIARSEILLTFPTVNTIHREREIGIVDELKKAVKRGVQIRILSPEDDFIKDKLDELRSSGVVIRRIETPTETKLNMIIVDKKVLLVVETKDDARRIFSQAIGLALYSNSKATVVPCASIFESLWRETYLYEKSRDAERIKGEFVNIAAHELRNPIMPILNGADLIQQGLMKHKDKFRKEDFEELFSSASLVIRNASKLMKLSEDILQVSRIESGVLSLNLEEVDLEKLVNTVIADIEKKYLGERDDVRIIFDSKLDIADSSSSGSSSENGTKIYCDGPKIWQTLYNLIDNAVKFTESGEVGISASVFKGEVMIQVQDSGKGIDPEIMDRLFEKFASKSNGGTGLGLFVSKKIVEAHGGRIWATQNKEKGGAIFTFTLPTDLLPEIPEEEISSAKDDKAASYASSQENVTGFKTLS